MKMKLILLAAAVALTGCEKEHRQSLPLIGITGTPAPTTEFKTFLAMGQSNMTGTGALSASTLDARVSFVGGVPGIGAIGNGPAYPFAINILDARPTINIRIIQCAVGGTPMEYWIPSGHLYQDCLALAHGYTIDGVIFSQGEADAQLNNTGWDLKFSSMVNGLRSDLHAPNLPVVYTQLGTNGPALPDWDTVKQEQAQVSLPKVSMVTTDDLDKVDQYHYTQASYALLGSRMARDMLGLL